MILTDIGFLPTPPPYPYFPFRGELFIAEETRLSGLTNLFEPKPRMSDNERTLIAQLARNGLPGSLFEGLASILGYHRG